MRLAVVLAAAALAGTAAAQTTITEETILSTCATGFEAADVNRDGWITREEAEAALVAHYALLDGDADGAVTRREFAACRAGSGLRTTTRRVATLRADDPVFVADVDGSGTLTEAEWLATGNRLVGEMPLSDGSASLVTFDGAMGGFALPATAVDANGDGRVSMTEAADGIIRGFRAADADGDGVVSIPEFANRDTDATVEQAGVDEGDLSRRLGALFVRLDADNDGALTLIEYQAFGRARFALAASAANSDPEVAVPVAVLDTLPPP